MACNEINTPNKYYTEKEELLTPWMLEDEGF